jgi:hypothetical protein
MITDNLVPCLLGHRQPIFLPQPWPDHLIAGKTLGLGEAVPESLLHRWREAGDLTWRLGNRAQVGKASARLRG